MSKHSVHLYLDDEVYDYLINKLADSQSVSSYFLQRSGIIPEYREFKKQPAGGVATAQPVPQTVEALSCTTCQLVQCDPSCAVLAHPTY